MGDNSHCQNGTAAPHTLSLEFHGATAVTRNELSEKERFLFTVLGTSSSPAGFDGFFRMCHLLTVCE